LTIETRSSAQVVAPHDGKVVFAGNFRGYGQLLIIDHGEGYHSLLAGMSRIDGIIGQYLLSGEPVGVMGSPKDGKPSLYIELRRNSQPINPAPWLVQKKNT
jgi:septal ring factor EnvC (AmiA/AmiB activator)